jgi:sodium-dependent dicarboxylate transporter 2/3/5
MDVNLKPQMSPAEERFESARKSFGKIAAPLLFLSLIVIPMTALNPEQHMLVAVLGLVMTLWITEAIPLAITGILAPIAMIVLGVVPAQKAFAPFADPIMFLFVGAFILARAIQLHKLDRRLAYAVLTQPWVGESPGRILFAFGAVCTLVSMWISNTATVAMMFPIGLAVIHMLKRANEQTPLDKYACAMMLICAFGASIGGLATPVGTPTNLIGLGFIERQLGVHVAFFDWMKFAVPLVVVLYLLLFLYLNFFLARTVKQFSGIKELLRREHETLGSMTRGERNTLLAFGVTVLLWTLPGILALTLGDDHAMTQLVVKHLPESVAALVGACLLLFLPAHEGERTQTLALTEALDIDWGVLAMYGGGIALGQTVFETKLAEQVGQIFASIIPTSGVGLIAFSSGIATIVSELTSNVSSANMVVPLVIAIGGHSSFQAALAATMASSLGFMLPISTPTNAIVYSSGFVPLGRMIRYGIVLDVLGFVVIVCASAVFL